MSQISVTMTMDDIFLTLARPAYELAHGPDAVDATDVFSCWVGGNAACFCDVIDVNRRECQRVGHALSSPISRKMR